MEKKYVPERQSGRRPDRLISLDTASLALEIDAAWRDEMIRYYESLGDGRETAEEYASVEMERLRGNRENYAHAVVDLMNLCINEDIDAVFFLGKSARPLGFLFKRVQQEVYPGVTLPKVRFINLGREESSRFTDSEAVKKVKGLFAQDVERKRVCVADDFKDTGRTMLRAKKFFEETFPDAKKILYKYLLPGQPEWNIAHSKHQLGVADTADDDEKHAFGFLSKPYDYGDPTQYLVGGDGDYEWLPKSEHDEFIILRKEMSSLARYIAQHCRFSDKGSFTVSPDIPELDRERVKLAEVFGVDPDVYRNI